MRMNVLSRATLLALVPLAMPTLAAAQVAAVAAAPARAAHDLEQITVTATRTEQAIKDVPATVDVVDREQMDRTLVRDLKDLFATCPACR